VTAPATLVTVHNTHSSEKVSEDALRRLVQAVLRREARKPSDISVILCGREEHQELNHLYLGRDCSTDVLAFPLGEGDGPDGEVYVDLDTARERHLEFDSSFESEVARYVVHGVLHLLGFDDHEPEDRSIMKEKEDAYVNLFTSQQS